MSASLLILLALALGITAPLGAADTVYTVQKGDTLAAIGRARYGSRAYAKLIALHNQMPDPGRLRAGAQLALPDLGGFLPRGIRYDAIETQVLQLAATQRAYQDAAAQFWQLWRDQGRRRQLALPTSVAITLSKVSADLAQLADSLGGPPAPQPAPSKASGQLRWAASLADQLAGGKVDAEGYDIDMVHQKIARATQYLLYWIQD